MKTSTKVLLAIWITLFVGNFCLIYFKYREPRTEYINPCSVLQEKLLDMYGEIGLKVEIKQGKNNICN